MTLIPTDYQRIRELVYERSAIVLGANKHYLIDARLSSLASELHFSGPNDLVRALTGPRRRELEDSIVEAMTTNETSFFRDGHPFDTLRTRILPDLIAQRRDHRRLSIWCGACSSGQEPYSLAILLREHFPQLHGWHLDFLATDLCETMVERSRDAVYSTHEVNRGMPAPLLVKYFDRKGPRWQVKADVRRMMRFRTLNLTGAWPYFPAVDLVMLRNVLIYFDVETKKQVLRRVRGVMRPGAVLMLGCSETASALDAGYERVRIERTTTFRRCAA